MVKDFLTNSVSLSSSDAGRKGMISTCFFLDAILPKLSTCSSRGGKIFSLLRGRNFPSAGGKSRQLGPPE